MRNLGRPDKLPNSTPILSLIREANAVGSHPRRFKQSSIWDWAFAFAFSSYQILSDINWDVAELLLVFPPEVQEFPLIIGHRFGPFEAAGLLQEIEEQVLVLGVMGAYVAAHALAHLLDKVAIGDAHETMVLKSLVGDAVGTEDNTKHGTRIAAWSATTRISMSLAALSVPLATDP